MASEPDIQWQGASGKSYNFWRFGLDFTPTAGTEGVYIFVRNTNQQYEAVYIGQGVLADRFAAHLDEGCATRKGAIEIHCFQMDSEASRRAAEKDLLEEHSEAYEPFGCNKKSGG